MGKDPRMYLFSFVHVFRVDMMRSMAIFCDFPIS